ncbi:MAG TPA: proton-conducting transporter membrane subunit, partial [Clostridia bacterium]
LVSNLLCITASVLGGAASLMQILSGNPPMHIGLLNSTIPFLSVDLTLDNLSAFFVLALSILVFCVSLYSIGYVSHYFGKRNVGLFNFLYATFILSMVLVLTSANMVVFYIAWEAMSLLSFFLVIFESEHKENLKAGTLYIIMTHIGAAFLLIGFMLVFSYTGSFDTFGSSAAIPGRAKSVIFLLFLFGFGIKAGVIPVHIWLPYAHPAAPGNVSALMSGIMIKTAIYGLLRFVFSFLGVEHTWWGVLLLGIGILSATIGVAYAFVEKNIKRLLAYSSIENIGILFIGLGVGFIASAKGNPLVSALAITASLLHAFNHTLFKGGLFLGAGQIQYAAHTKDMEEMGGLVKNMPVTALLMLGGSLSIAALVPFNGFIGEWLTYQALFANIASGQAGLNILSILTVAALALAGALAAASFVKLFGISFLGLPRSVHAANAKEVPWVMNAGTGILILLCLFIGLFPMFLLKIIDGVIGSLTGTSLAGQLGGGFLVAWYPLDIAGSRISPLAILLVILGVALLSLLLIRLVGGKYLERKYGTWDCGYEALSARMQYSSTGFSKPVKIVFKMLFRPSRSTKVVGDRKYHPESIAYETTSEYIFEKYIYHPAYRMLKVFSRKTKLRVQTGSIYSYLAYILAAVILLMVYNMLF